MNPAPFLHEISIYIKKKPSKQIYSAIHRAVKRCWMNRKVFIFISLFILSRIIFINPLPVFFDSPEYFTRFSDPNYFKAIASGHLPFHSGYIILLWPIFHVAEFFGISSSLAVISAQVIISVIGVYCFYKLTVLVLNKKIAFIAAIIASFTPLYWITNISVMMEAVYINFFLISLFLLVKYAKSKNSRISLLFGSLFFGFAFFTHPLIILWLPFLLFIIYIGNRKKTLTALFALSIAVFIFGALNTFLIAYSLQISLEMGAQKYLFDKLSEHVQISGNISSVFIVARNTIIPLLRNNTSLVVILSVISLIALFRKNKRIFVLGILWIVPSIISNQWWDSLLFGRHSAIAGFGFAFLSALLLEKRKLLTSIVIIYILIVSLPALSLLKQPIPYLEEQRAVRTLPDGLLIDTHFARPQIQGNYSGDIFFVNEPAETRKLGVVIDEYLKNDDPVFITSQALSDPYGLYSGPYLHSLSLSYAKKFEVENIISLYTLSKYATVDENANIVIFKIISRKNSKYPIIPRLYINSHRMDYFDPISQLWFLIKRS